MNQGVETTDKEWENKIKKDMEELKRRYATINDKLWNLETRMDNFSRDQAEGSCAIQSKLDALLRNSMIQEETASGKKEAKL